MNIFEPIIKKVSEKLVEKPFEIFFYSPLITWVIINLLALTYTWIREGSIKTAIYFILVIISEISPIIVILSIIFWLIFLVILIIQALIHFIKTKLNKYKSHESSESSIKLTVTFLTMFVFCGWGFAFLAPYLPDASNLSLLFTNIIFIKWLIGISPNSYSAEYLLIVPGLLYILLCLMFLFIRLTSISLLPYSEIIELQNKEKDSKNKNTNGWIQV